MTSSESGRVRVLISRSSYRVTKIYTYLEKGKRQVGKYIKLSKLVVRSLVSTNRNRGDSSIFFLVI